MACKSNHMMQPAMSLMSLLLILGQIQKIAVEKILAFQNHHLLA